MNRKMLIGFTLVMCLAISSFTVLAMSSASDDAPSPLQEGEDSPGVHQCPRDNYDDNAGPTDRNGFGDSF